MLPGLVRYVLLTVALVAGLAGVLLGGAALMVWLLPPAVGVPALVVFLIVFLGVVIYQTPRLQAYWTPVAARVDRRVWTDGEGRARKAVVERAHLRAATAGGLGAISSYILRVSSYVDGERDRRRLIGDDADYLGWYDGGFWFYIRSRYHARRRGLVCVDPATCEFRFHLPREQGAPIDDQRLNRSPIVKLVAADGQPRTVDLRTAARGVE